MTEHSRAGIVPADDTRAIVRAGIHESFLPQSTEIDARRIWHEILRNKGIVLVAMVLAVLVAHGVNTYATPIYSSDASIRIDAKQNLLGAGGLNLLDADGGQLGTEAEMLRSRSLAEDVIDSLQLRVVAKEPARVPRDLLLGDIRLESGAPAAEYELVRNAKGRFDVHGVRRGSDHDFAIGDTIRLPGLRLRLRPLAQDYHKIRLVVVSSFEASRTFRASTVVERPNRDAAVLVVRHKGSDPILASSIPNTLARLFIARRQRVQSTEARSTVAFLHEQIDSLNSQLSASEDSLRLFREHNQVISLEAEGTAKVGRLAALQSAYADVSAERSALAELIREVKAEAAASPPNAPSPYRRLLAFPTLFKNPVTSQLLGALSQADEQRTNLLVRRTMADPDVAVLTNHIHEIETQIRVLATSYVSGLQKQETALAQELASFGRQLERVPATEGQYARLERRPKVLADIYTLLQQRLKEAQIQQAIEDPSVQLIDTAVVPLKPTFPRPKLNLALASLVGLTLGIGLAFVRERMDVRIHTREEVEKIVGAHVLGTIPHIDVDGADLSEASLIRRWLRAPIKTLSRASSVETRANGQGQSWRDQPSYLDTLHRSRGVVRFDPRGIVAEAYRGLRTNITFAQPSPSLQILLFTSALPGEGKTTTATNLALTLAQQGLRVLLIDADLRRGVLHRVFDVPASPGLSNLLISQASLQSCISTVQLGEGIVCDIMPAGNYPPNPAELLGSTRLRECLAECRARYDIIVIDAAPINLVTDAAVLSTASDGTVIVARAGATTRNALGFAVAQLRQVQAPVLGAVLNDADTERAGYYGEYAEYAY